MGLDNGWYVKSSKHKLTRADLPVGIRYPFSKDYDEEGVEVAYARKCWGLRTDLINHIAWDEIKNDYFYIIENPDKLFDVMDIIASWLNEEKWESEGNSIWEYKDIKDTLLNWIINFAFLQEYMRQNPDIYLEFYDSY